MSALSLLLPVQREMLAEAGVAVLLPEPAPAGRVEADAQMTVRHGDRLLSTFRLRVTSDEPEPVLLLELMTFGRDLPMLSIPAAERGEVHDALFMHDYLGREARSEIAMRSLELGDGEASTLTTPLDKLILDRQAELPPAQEADVRVDGHAVRARTIAFGDHTVTWADLPDERVAFVVYTRAPARVPALVAQRA